MNGLIRFSQAVEQAKQAKTRPERMKAIATAIREHGDAVCSASSRDREALLLELSAIPGMSANMASIRKSLAPRPVMRLAEPDEGAPAIELSGVDLPEIRAPRGWIVTDAGITKLTERDGEMRTDEVTIRPVLITGILSDIDEATRQVFLEWRGDFKWEHQIVKMSAIQDQRAFCKLTDYGVPVSAKNARYLGEFLDDLKEQNGLPVAHSTTRLGWADGGRLGFLCGDKLISATGTKDATKTRPTTWGESTVFLDLDEADGKSQLIKAYCTAGDFDEWNEVFERATAHPSAAIGVYLSLVAPAMIIFKHAMNPVIEWAGETSKGKTTALKLAASCWGDPSSTGGLIQKWNATAKAREEIWLTNCFLPSFFDDTKDVIKKDQAQIPQAVYAYSGGVGKGRGTINGMARTAHFHGVLFSTGESPVTSFSQDAGARARVLGLSGSPWGTTDQSVLVDDINLTLDDCYGHAGPAVVRWLAENRDKWDAIRASHEKTRMEYRDRADCTVGKRSAGTIAFIKLGMDLARKIGLPAPKSDPLEYAWKAAMSASVDADRPAQALRDIYSWCAEHDADLWGRHVVDRDGCARQPTRGWAGAWKRGNGWRKIGITQTAIQRLLSREGYEPAAILQSWRERDWLVTDGKSIASKMTVGPNKARPRVICVKREAIEEVMGERL